MNVNSDNLKAYKEQAMKDFQKQNGLLKKRAQDIHNQYVQPTYQLASKHASQRPITAAFTSLFLVFSFIPLVSFAFFTVATLVTLVGLALFWSTVLISGAAIILFTTLFFTASFAVGGLFWGVLGYESYRLVQNLIAAPHLVDGLKNFEGEARSLFLGSNNNNVVQEVQNSTSKVSQATSNVIDNVVVPSNGFKVE